MISKRLITVLTFDRGILFRTKLFRPDYRYTANFVDTWSVDEIILLDITRDYNADTRNNFYKVVNKFSENCFVPLTVGGWIKDIKEVKKLMSLGADKVSINSHAIKCPDFLSLVSKSYGSQSIVLSIDVKKNNNGDYEVYSNQATNRTRLKLKDWVKKGEKLGAGEILVTSIEKDGWLRGYDLDLCKEVKSAVNIPVILLGGCGNWEHIYDAFTIGNADGACTQNIYHFTEASIKSAKNFLKKKGLRIRI